MSNEEFEDLFGNVPFSDLKKIYEYLNKVFIPKDVIRDKIKELEENNYVECIEFNLEVIEILKSLLGE